jgi:nitrogen-specific signal transduction histidine kinase
MNQALLNAHAQSVISIDAEDDVQILSAASSAMLVHHSRLLTIRSFVKFKR